MIIAVRLGALTRPGDFEFHLPNLISLPGLTVLMNSPGSCQVLIRHLSSCVFFADEPECRTECHGRAIRSLYSLTSPDPSSGNSIEFDLLSI